MGFIDTFTGMFEDYWWVFLIIGGIILLAMVGYVLWIQYGIYVKPWLYNLGKNQTEQLMQYDYRELIDVLPKNCNCTCT